MTYYAHTKTEDKSEWQSVYDHLTHTADLAAELGRDAGVSDLARVAGLMHDIGKYSPAFQRRLEGAPGKVDHSTPGAKELMRLFEGTPQKALAEALAYCIAGHHTGLPDCGSRLDVEGESTLQSRLKGTHGDYGAYQSEIDPAQISLPKRLAIRPLAGHVGFSIAFLTRIVYSALVDADFQETEQFVSGKKPRGGYESIEALCQRFDRFMEAFGNPQNAINRKRSETLKACIEAGPQKPGFFTLTVPTGGGKTLASMAFALHHARQHSLKRIIYVIPFTSIIEQNAAVF